MGLWNILNTDTVKSSSKIFETSFLAQNIIQRITSLLKFRSVIYVLRLNSDEKYFKNPRNDHFEI